ncbi:MAG: flagellar biosynthesis anti-sigma factor FlgM [Bradymonadia bacterium]
MAIRIGGYGPAEQAERARSRSAAKAKGGKGEALGSKDAPAAKGAATGMDTVKLQGNSAAVNTVREATDGLSEVDAAKVAELKAAIKEGRYEVNPDAIASAMVDEATELEG